jgi:hypothetical protein
MPSHDGRIEQDGVLLAWVTHAKFGPLAEREKKLIFYFLLV